MSWGITPGSTDRELDVIGWLLKVTRKSCIARIMKDVLRTDNAGSRFGETSLK